MTQRSPHAPLSIADLPAIVIRLFARAGRPLLPDRTESPRLFLRYLRRKPGRGLAAIYAVDAARRRGAPGRPARQRLSAVSLTLDETALDGTLVRFDLAEVEQAVLEIQPAGGIFCKPPGLAVQAFPADSGLPTLAESCDTAQSGPLFQALAAAARVSPGDADWRLVAAEAEPVRYKPANRCVIRYALLLERDGAQGQERRTLPIFGKVYADPAQARVAYQMQEHLFLEQEQQHTAPPMLPRPLGLLESLGLMLSEAVPPFRAEEHGVRAPAPHVLTGSAVFQPQIERGRGGVVSQVVMPAEELSQTAQALARLHTSALDLAQMSLRSGGKEAKRLRERAGLLAAWYPAQAEEIKRLSEQLAWMLEAGQPLASGLAHGGFKPSQLLFARGRVYVVDFDGLCLADPALDVGYFLAYLRPSGLWYQRPGLRAWFEGAAAAFRVAYEQALLQRGEEQTVVSGILRRARWYEAALLFKIATRRVNRLQSARPGELAALLHEVAGCLAG